MRPSLRHFRDRLFDRAADAAERRPALVAGVAVFASWAIALGALAVVCQAVGILRS